MRWAGVVVLLVALAGCGDDDDDVPVADAAALDGAAAAADAGVNELTCGQIQTMWRARVDALANDCVVDDDCVAPGDTEASETFCECGPTLAANCHGDPVNAAAYAADDVAHALYAEFHARCLDADCEEVECPCDCEPGIARCTDTGFCTVEQDGECFPDLAVDAGSK